MFHDVASCYIYIISLNRRIVKTFNENIYFETFVADFALSGQGLFVFERLMSKLLKSKKSKNFEKKSKNLKNKIKGSKYEYFE